MLLVVKEIVKYYATTLNSPVSINGSKLLSIQARIVKMVGENDHYWYEVGTHFKQEDSDHPYKTSKGGPSVESAERSLISYLEDFQQAVLEGAEVIPNPYY